ncbi:MAG: DUF4389 domain-containing protein [Vicingaceae bacterium]
MNFDIKRQETYSRGELLLRSFFGVFYILIPHMFVLFFLAIASMVMGFIAFWAILFTGKYPKGMFEFQVKFRLWELRVNARLLNLSDGYPAFGLDAKDDSVTFEMEYPESLSRGNLLLKAFFGFFYVLIPHIFILYFRIIGVYVVVFIAWWAVLFTGKYPKGMFDFVVGTFRWFMRLGLFMGNMSDTYPAFTGKVLAGENQTQEVIES